MRSRAWFFAVSLLTATVSALAVARADQTVVTYSVAKTTSPNFTNSASPSSDVCLNASVCDFGVENFTGFNPTTGGYTFTTNFTDGGYSLATGVSFHGSYTNGTGTTTGAGGEWISQSQNEYGGVSGENYPELYGNGAPQVTQTPKTATSTAVLTLTSVGVPGINYFGIWISALDPYNNLTIYDGSTVIATFNSAQLEAELGTCSNPSANAYCGNPTSQFSGQDNGELFAYVNVFDLTGYITSVVLTDASGTGFESDNYAVAYVTPIHVVGTVVPEPSTLAVMSVGIAALSRARRKARQVSL
jgi:hypothetical protein